MYSLVVNVMMLALGSVNVGVDAYMVYGVGG